tara:strand:- start:74 stop:349 length:276 start_codon:yes stop_codon:yes gene_type:complete
MDPEATLKNILDLFDAVSNSDLDERDLGEYLWDLKYAVSDYSDWIKQGGFSPNFQNVVKEWLTKKQDEVKNSPDKKQKQLWDDSALGRFDL